MLNLFCKRGVFVIKVKSYIAKTQAFTPFLLKTI